MPLPQTRVGRSLRCSPLSLQVYFSPLSSYTFWGELVFPLHPQVVRLHVFLYCSPHTHLYLLTLHSFFPTLLGCFMDQGCFAVPGNLWVFWGLSMGMRTTLLDSKLL